MGPIEVCKKHWKGMSINERERLLLCLGSSPKFLNRQAFFDGDFDSLPNGIQGQLVLACTDQGFSGPEHDHALRMLRDATMESVTMRLLGAATTRDVSKELGDKYRGYCEFAKGMSPIDETNARRLILNLMEEASEQFFREMRDRLDRNEKKGSQE